jgi:hypothetical protein
MNKIANPIFCGITDFHLFPSPTESRREKHTIVVCPDLRESTKLKDGHRRALEANQ